MDECLQSPPATSIFENQCKNKADPFSRIEESTSMKLFKFNFCNLVLVLMVIGAFNALGGGVKEAKLDISNVKNKQGTLQLTMILLERPDGQGVYGIVARIKNLDSKPITLKTYKAFESAFLCFLDEKDGETLCELPEVKENSPEKDLTIEDVILAPTGTKEWTAPLKQALEHSNSMNSIKDGNYEIQMRTMFLNMEQMILTKKYVRISTKSLATKMDGRAKEAGEGVSPEWH